MPTILFTPSFSEKEAKLVRLEVELFFFSRLAGDSTPSAQCWQAPPAALLQKNHALGSNAHDGIKFCSLKFTLSEVEGRKKCKEGVFVQVRTDKIAAWFHI